MPYDVKKRGSKYVLTKRGSSKRAKGTATHSSAAKAGAQAAAIMHSKRRKKGGY